MSPQHIQQFHASPFALESTNPEGGYFVGFAKELRFNFDEPDRPMVEVLSDADPRTLGLVELIEDSTDAARWLTVNGSTMWARPLRPYDAVAAGRARFPIGLTELPTVLFDGSIPPPDDHPESLLKLRTAQVWE